MWLTTALERIVSGSPTKVECMMLQVCLWHCPSLHWQKVQAKNCLFYWLPENLAGLLPIGRQANNF